MEARELMTRSVECVSPDMKIQEAARVMKSLDVGFLPVCEHDRLVGTITDRDIVLRVIAEGRNIKDCKARDVMTDEVFWIYEDQTADDVAEYMARKEIHRVLVLDRNKRLTGVISIGDLARDGDREKAGETMGQIADSPPAKAA